MQGSGNGPPCIGGKLTGRPWWSAPLRQSAWLLPPASWRSRRQPFIRISLVTIRTFRRATGAKEHGTPVRPVRRACGVRRGMLACHSCQEGGNRPAVDLGGRITDDTSAYLVRLSACVASGPLGSARSKHEVAGACFYHRLQLSLPGVHGMMAVARTVIPRRIPSAERTSAVKQRSIVDPYALPSDPHICTTCAL